jgi:hypothetical protein
MKPQSPTPDETTKLFSNALDALDKLYDRELDINDVQDLLFATSLALRNTAHFTILNQSVASLTSISRIDKTDDEINGDGLEATGALRVYLANLVSI